MIVCAGESEQFGFAAPVGIGLMDAAMTLTALCITEKPKEICFVGTAGSYGEIEKMQIIESSAAANIENSFFTASAYSPIENIVSCETSKKQPIVNSSNYITTDSTLAVHYLKKNIHLENMEFYAIVKVAQRFDIPVRGIFCVTNYCDADAHKDFLKNHKEAMRLLTRYITSKNIG